MIDGIKTGYLPLNVNELSALLGVELNRQTVYTNKNGLIFGFIHAADKSTGELRYMCGIRGSVHTFKNHGTHNADKFRLSDLNNVLNELRGTYGIRPEITPIYSVEFGVNLRLPYQTSRVINAIKAYKSKQFVPMGEIGIEYKSSLYTLKIYDKSRKYKEFERSNILRIEIKAKCSYLRRKGVYVSLLDDLLNPELWKAFERMLLDAVDNTTIVEAIRVNGLKSKEKELIILFTGNEWRALDRKSLYKKRKRFNELIKNLEASTIKDELKDLISNECRELRGENQENGDKINVFSSLDNSKPEKLIYKTTDNETLKEGTKSILR